MDKVQFRLQCLGALMSCSILTFFLSSDFLFQLQPMHYQHLKPIYSMESQVKSSLNANPRKRDNLVDTEQIIVSVGNLSSVNIENSANSFSIDNDNTLPNTIYADRQPVTPDNTTAVLLRGIQENETSLTDDKAWGAKIAQRFSERKQFLETQCSSYGDNVPKTIERRLLNAFYYAKKYDFLACVSAKGGASTWKTHLLHMNGYQKPIKSPHQAFLESKIVALDVIGGRALSKKMTAEMGVTRVISVRHPLARLVSAYRDKYSNGDAIVPGKTRGRFFRGPVLLMGEKSFSASKKMAVPFEYFLLYVIQEKRRGIRGMNRHWRPYSSACAPCHVKYDYIIQLETLEDDLRYLVLNLGIQEIDVTVRKNKSEVEKKTPTYEQYFKDIPDEVIRNIYSVYQEDFYLFGYEIPEFIKESLSKNE